MARNDTLQADVELIKSVIRKEKNSHATFVQATFLEAETSDSNLSHIRVYGKSMRSVRKLGSVGSMAAGQQLLCVQGDGVGVIIIGVIVGNVKA